MIDGDGSPAAVRFSGVCHNSLPPCSFAATLTRTPRPIGGGRIQLR